VSGKIPTLKILFATTAVVAMMVFASPARSEVVKELVLSDGGELSKERVADLLGAKVGQDVTESQLEEGLKRLSNTGRFQGLEVSFDPIEGRVVLQMRLYDVLDSVEFRSPGEIMAIPLFNLVSRDVEAVTALSRGDRISLDQIPEIRDRVLQRLRDRGFKDVQVVIALEEGEVENQKKLLVSAKLGSQEKVSEVEFHGFRGVDLKRMRDLLEETDYVTPFLKKLDVSADIVDRPEDYLLDQFKRLRNADEGKPTNYQLDFPLDWVLINSSLNDWGQLMRAEGFFDFRLQAGVVPGKGGIQKLLVTLDRGPRYNIQFIGNVNFWERRLKERVLDRPMRLGLPLNLSDAQTQIRAMYLADGFKDVKVDFRSEDRDVERRIEFTIVEGRRSFLGKVLWDGLSPREIEVLQEIEDEWKSEMSTPFHHVYFDERALRTQLPQLLLRIRSQGFLQARLLGFKAVPSGKSDRMDLEIPIQLGPRFKLREIVVEGDHPISRQRLDDIVDISPGDIAREDRIVLIAQEITREVRDEGFINPTISTKLEDIVTYSDTSDEVDLKYSIDIGPQVKVGQIVVDGLRRTKERVVLREFDREDMGSGETWVPTKLDDIDQRLLSYGLFGNLRIQASGDRVIQQASESESRVEIQERDIRVSVTERPGGAIEFGPGYRTELGVVAFGEYNYRNLGGMNRSVVVRGQVSKKLQNFQFLEQKYSLNYLEPYILDIPLSFRFGTAYETRDLVQYNTDNVPVSGYNKEQVSVSFGLVKEFNRHISLSHNLYSISSPKIYNLQGSDTSGEILYRIATMGPTLTFDYRDNFFTPTRGSMFSTSLEYTSPGIGSSDAVHYFHNRNEFSNYQLLRKGFVFATSFAIAHMNTLSNVPNIPVDKQLELGGRSTIRSLKESAVNYQAYADVKSQNSYLVKVELRQDLFEGLGFAYFFDVGRVDTLGIKGVGWREALGVGVRYATPVGPLALDFAFNADKRAGEDFSRILFSVGVF